MTKDDEVPDIAKAPDRTSLVGHVELDCDAVLGHGTMTVSQLSALATGDVVPLDRNPADPVDVVVNGKTIARGEIVTADGMFAVRITELA